MNSGRGSANDLPEQYVPPASIGCRRYACLLADALAAECGRTPLVPKSLPRQFGCGGHFHIANSTRRLLPYVVASASPGLITLHDLVPRSQFVRLVFTQLQYLMIRRLPLVVHSKSAAAWVKRLAPSARVHVIPHAADPTGLDVALRQQVREAWGAGPRMVLVSAGIQNRQKQIPQLISGVSELSQVLLVVAGRIADEETRAALAAAPDNVMYLGIPDDRRFAEIIASGDYLANFRPVSVGEASGPAAIAYASRVPVAGYAFGAQAEFGTAEDVLFPPDLPIEECLLRLYTKFKQVGFRQRSVGALDWTESARAYLALYRLYGLA